jgi:hypothetical protein
MADTNTLLITAGDVIDVQLTSETVVIEGADVRHLEPGHITNRMRLFVREGEGQERKYDFDDTELGVRETQRVAIVRGRVKGVTAPLNLILFNLSSGEQEPFEQGLAVYLARKPLFGTIAKAVLFSVLVALIAWLTQLLFDIGYDGGLGFGLALMLGLFAYPVFWWSCGVWDTISERGRYQRARKRFIAEMTGRVRAYASAPQRGPQPTPGAPPPVAEPPPAAEPSGA